MSVVVCSMCNRWVDTDFYPAFYHKKTHEAICESCFSYLDDETAEENYYE